MAKFAAKPLYLAPDTNVLLHFRRPDLLDWSEQFGKRPVVLIFVANTLREIERHKDGNRTTRQRAREITAWLRKAEAGALKGKLSFDFRATEPQQFPSGLDETVGDDRFVASLAELASSGLEVVALTNDFLLQLKLRGHGLPWITPPDGAALADDEDDVMLRLKRLEKQYAEQPSPILTAHWGSGGKTKQVSFASPARLLSPAEEEVAIPRFEAQSAQLAYYDHWSMPRPTQRAPLAHRLGDKVTVSEQQARSYNAQVDQYQARYAVFYKTEEERLRRKSRALELSITVANNGRAPATAPRVRIELQSGLSISQLQPSWGTQQEPPIPPRIPTSIGALPLEAAVPQEQRLYCVEHGTDQQRLAPMSDYLAEARLLEIQQGDERELSRLKVIADEGLAGSTATITVTFWAHELPDPVVSVLQLEIAARAVDAAEAR